MYLGWSSLPGDHDAFAFDADGLVWNGGAYVVPPAGGTDPAAYRVAATRTGSGASGDFEGTLPNGYARWQLRARGSTWDDSPVVYRGASSGGGSGTGAFVYTVTAVDEYVNPVVGATVRLTGGAEARVGTTGSDGTVAFGVNAGAYTLSATASGRSHTPESFGVTGSGDRTVTLAAVAIAPPAAADQTTAYTTTRDGQGAAVGGVVLYFRLKAPAGAVDSYDRSDFAATSAGFGLLQVALPKSAQMEGRRGTKGAWVAFTTGTDATFELPQTLGGYGR